ISGFVTRGRGVSIHRTDCRDFQRLAASAPERVVTAQWNLDSPQNHQPDHVAHFAIDMEVFASDRPGLLRDITEVLSREKINVTAAHTHNRRERAHMRFTLQVTGIDQMQRAFALIGEIPGVTAVHRSGGA
ncbi:MAG: bifunctional (p)ppGpp synthetase/guanosine-3',5'-bis(diphosphate) 3'-pyrophosphohydrolase, partial [Rhodocyclaceae bacterium]|nr:bifunctional (p)ppGpp synthetase/guanosine-3',5'-bis(diphosphate) 3'-pyrophosphohydrolase [Rhodocyclaceae bacterium]